ncbi:peptidase [Lentilactobacillus kefiri]|uniref:prepilin peptidase n=1 Tax=Lentilactobacillus kefiri TaxID=33962 RepID=UPI000BA53BBD|nr:A24 family peptidase [Lentilactobacillus kefiri]PAK60390.1 peptidase [Lentilactobacillus kefiri]
MMIIIQFLFGASIASFFNLVAVRVVRGESIVRPRSHCDSCQNQLANIDLVPVFSYIILKGKCRYCSQKLPINFFAVELFTGTAIFCLNLWVIDWLFIIQFVILIALSSFDLVNQQIPMGGIIGLLLSSVVVTDHPVQQIVMAVALYGVTQMINHHAQWIGSGDIDIYFCIWLSTGVPFLLWQTFIACVVALLYLIVAPWPKDSKIPFVPFITIGYFVTSQLQNILLPLIS